MAVIAHLQIVHDQDVLLAAVLLLDALLEFAHRAPVARHRDAVSVALLGRRHRAQVDVVGLHVVFVARVQARLARSGEGRARLLEDEGEHGAQGGETGGEDSDGQFDIVPDGVGVFAVEKGYG